MQPATKEPIVLRDFREFVAFLHGLWGVPLVPILFPLSNQFIQLIPLTDDFGPLARLAPGPIASAAILISIFVLLGTFEQRRELALPTHRAGVRRQALISVLVALVALAIYLVALPLPRNGLYGDTGHSTPLSDLRLVAGDLVFAVLYVGFFALATRAFVLMAVLLYASSENNPTTSGSAKP